MIFYAISVENAALTLIMVRAEKVKQLEKEIEELKQNRDEYKEEYIKLLNARYYDYISKDKIKELKEKVEKEMISNPYDFSYMINELLKEE